MNLDQYNETVLGLPELLHPKFWESLIEETFWMDPKYDEERGIVWEPYYAPAYEDKVRLLSASQMLTGLKREILRNLNALGSREERWYYLDKLIRVVNVDKKRAIKEGSASAVYDFRESDEGDIKSELASAHAELLINLQALINSAYWWDLDDPKIGNYGSPHGDFEDTMQSVERNGFNSAPLEYVREYFREKLCIPNKSGDLFLSLSDLDKFISKGILKNPLEEKLTINIGSAGNAYVGAVFHKFYVKCKVYEPTEKCAEKYKKLATDNFSNWTEARFSTFFRS